MNYPVTRNQRGVYAYTVQGRGDFPWDMLRYDRAYPLTDPSPSQYETDPKAWTTARTVQIEGQDCTPDRWASFLWTVVPV